MAVRCAAVFLFLSVILPKSADADLITHFNFNGYDGNSATILADSGTGVIVLEEEGSPWPADELDLATGTTVNAVFPDPAGDALSLGNNGDATLARTLTFEIDTTGYRDILFSTALAVLLVVPDVGLGIGRGGGRAVITAEAARVQEFRTVAEPARRGFRIPAPRGRKDRGLILVRRQSDTPGPVRAGPTSAVPSRVPTSTVPRRDRRSTDRAAD